MSVQTKHSLLINDKEIYFTCFTFSVPQFKKLGFDLPFLRFIRIAEGISVHVSEINLPILKLDTIHHWP